LRWTSLFSSRPCLGFASDVFPSNILIYIEVCYMSCPYPL
jgi:hypothetical protein